ncbi:MAG: hypothetical protein A2046_04140 [Bacteroidetes bacterium GWA2_30_7]|nr:MAG: hypothetical protein A2046_04140 [Bacteroidetes bacterium GWA2_30_7]
MKQILLFLFVGLLFITVKCQTSQTDCKIKITEPKDMDSVKWQPIVRGNITGNFKEVWVIVHPMANGLQNRWVQPKVSFKNDTTWQVQIYIAEQGSQYIGEHFEIKAFVDPQVTLSDGKVLNEWPKAKCSSDIIEVIRKGK